jgi:hypothetical protein
MDDLPSIVRRVKTNPNDQDAWQQLAEQVPETDKIKYCLGQVARIKNQQQGFTETIQCHNCGTLMEIYIATGFNQKRARCSYCRVEKGLESGSGKAEVVDEVRTNPIIPTSQKEPLSDLFLKGCGLFFISFVIFFAIYYLLVGQQLRMPTGLILSFLGSIFMVAAIGNFRGALDKRNTLRLMQKALQDGSAESYSEGDKAIFFGKIYPLDGGNPILTPFSKQACVFYTYSVYRWVWKSSGEHNRRVKEHEFNGMYLTPSCVHTNMGKVRLLAYPSLEGFQEHTYSYPDSQNFYREAANYLQTTQFTDRPRDSIQVIGDAFQQIKEIFTDDDGFIRRDNKLAQEMFDLKTRLLDERYVLAGEDVCLQGIWSAEKLGVVGDLSKAPAILTKGTPEKAMNIVRNGIFMKALVGVALALVINGLIGNFWFLSTVAPRLGIGTVTHTETYNGEIITQATPTSSTSAVEQRRWQIYINNVGHYSYEYPTGWANKEINSQTIDTSSGQTAIHLSTAYKPDIWLMLDVIYRLDGGQCIQKEFWTSHVTGMPINVGGVTGTTYEINDEIANYFNKAVYLPKGDRCLQILIQDNLGNPNKALFEHMISSFTFTK